MPNPTHPAADPTVPGDATRPARVMLSLDASSADWGVLDLAVNVAALLDGELHGLWQENAALLQVAGLPCACEIGLNPALERALEPEQLLRSLRGNRRRIETHLARCARTARVQWSLQAVPQRQSSAWEGEVFDVLVMGQQGGLPRSQWLVAQPARQRLLCWLDSAASVAMSKALLARLAAAGALEVYLVSSPQQQVAAQALGAWLATVGIPYYRVAYGGDLASLKTALLALRIRPDFALVPQSLGWDEIGKLAQTLPCPLLVAGEGKSGQLGQTHS